MKTIRLVLTAVAVLFAAFFLDGCSDGVEVLEEPKLRPVRVSVVTTNSGGRLRTFSGVAQSAQQSRLSFKVAGTIVELPVQVGDNLAKGDLLARLNPSSFDLEVQRAEASLAQADANRRNANANYERVKGLYENTNASRNELDSARATAESSRAQVRSAGKALEIAQLNRSYTRLTAATDCTVSDLSVDLNENVSAGGEVARVSCGQGMEIGLGVPESLIGGMTQGMSVQVSFDSIANRTFSGTLSEVGSTAAGGAATFPVVVTLDQFDAAIRPGIAAEVAVRFNSASQAAITIPSSAVINDERGIFVYVAEPGSGETGIIRRQEVVIGELVGEGIEVISGLSEGDRVVTAGTSVIREQQTVLIPRA